MKIILHIHSDGHFTWIQLNEHHEMVVQQDYQKLSDIPAVLKGMCLVVLLPGQEIVTTLANIPKINRHELTKAIPFALEEQLATDIDQLYFAIGHHDDNNHLSVAVIDKEKFEAYLHALKSHRLYPDYVLPDYLAIPLEKGHWSIDIKQSMALVRIDQQRGFAVEIENLPLLLQWTLDRAQEMPHSVRVYDRLGEYPMQQLASIKNQVNVEICRNVAALAWDELAHQPSMNLLKRKYHAQNKSSSLKRYWKIAGVSCVAWVVVLFGSQGAQWVHLHHQVAWSQQQIHGLYHQIFPASHAVIEPQMHVRQELNRLLQLHHGNPLITLLSRVAEILHHYPSVKIQMLSYQDGNLILHLKTTELSQLEALTQALTQQQLQVKQNQVNTKDKQIFAEVWISS